MPIAWLSVIPVAVDVLVANFVAPVNEYKSNYQLSITCGQTGTRE
jgi:hypothetical protein